MNKQVVDVERITVRIITPRLDIDSLYKELKSVEGEPGFLGFVSLEWSVGNLPEITYHKRANEDSSSN